MIHFEHVSKNFGRTAAVSDVTFEIGSGDFVFFVGPSGAGKTTILRLITRDLLPSKGKVVVDGWDIGTLPTNKVHILRRSVGMVFQDFKLLADRTVFENVSIGLEILGKSRAQIEKRVDEVLDLVKLGEKKNLFPAQISAGEMQRTGIARAIVAGPKILMADEPTKNIMQVLFEINALGTTVLMATHNEGIVNEGKKRTIELIAGEIVSDKKKGSYPHGRS